MVYVYCLVPERLKGKVLYPLNILKRKRPKIYRYEVKRYKSRKKVLKKRIPVFNCLWNDVLHFTPIHPSKIRKELKKAGAEVKKLKWFKINAKRLDPRKTIIYLYKLKKNKKDFMSEDNFTKYNPEKLSKYNEVPEKTKRYYRQEVEKGKSPLRFHLTPHVLFRGNLDISKAKMIEV